MPVMRVVQQHVYYVKVDDGTLAEREAQAKTKIAWYNTECHGDNVDPSKEVELITIVKSEYTEV